MRTAALTDWWNFKRHRHYEERKRSAVALIHYVLANHAVEVLATHRGEILTVLLWKLTQAEGGKYGTLLKSSGTRNCKDKKKLRHDHVFQRAKMIAALIKAAPDQVDKILATAVGCTVTAKEHKRLSKFDKTCDGWKRYRRAKIVVFDTQTGRRHRESQN
jgi:hypothetical protein